MRKTKQLKKSIGIVGEGLTERMYFDYIRNNRRHEKTPTCAFSCQARI